MTEIQEGFGFVFKDGTRRWIGADKNGNLYWDGRPIQLKQKITLSWWVNFSAVVAALATAAQAVVAVLEYLKT